MFECTLEQGELFKRIITALSDLVTEGNFMIDGAHIFFQGMDSSHVSLCALSLRSSGFRDYRCDRDITLGLNFTSLQKVLKCMGSKDALSIKHEEETDVCLFIFQDPNESRISNFELKLMDIDAEQLGIPDTEYAATVRMPSSEFQRICRDLAAIGDSVTIDVSKDGVTFSVAGSIGNGRMCLKGQVSTAKRKGNKNKNKNGNGNGVKVEDDEDLDMEADSDGGDSHEENTGNVDDDPEKQVMIQMLEPVKQQFALRYLNNFTKATNLSKTVLLQMGAEVPLLCEYQMDNGYIRYYLAPKIDDDE